MRKILGISGKDSCAAALILKLHNPNDWAEVELFFNDTGCDYPCVHDWLKKVEAYFEKPIAFIDGDLPGAIAHSCHHEKHDTAPKKPRFSQWKDGLALTKPCCMAVFGTTNAIAQATLPRLKLM